MVNIDTLREKIGNLTRVQGKELILEATSQLLETVSQLLRHQTNDLIAGMVNVLQDGLMSKSRNPRHSGSFPNNTYKKFLFSCLNLVKTDQFSREFLQVGVFFFQGIMEEHVITGIVQVARGDNQTTIRELNQRYDLALDTRTISNTHIIFFLQALLRQS